jgi:hypothetical protein
MIAFLCYRWLTFRIYGTRAESKIYSNQQARPTKIDTQHENFEDLLICVKNDINVLLVGEAEAETTERTT